MLFASYRLPPAAQQSRVYPCPSWPSISNRAEEGRGRGTCTARRLGGWGGGAEDRAEGARADEHLDLDVGGLDWSQQKGRTREPLDQGAGAVGPRPRAAGEDSGSRRPLLLPFLLPSLWISTQHRWGHSGLGRCRRAIPRSVVPLFHARATPHHARFPHTQNWFGLVRHLLGGKTAPITPRRWLWMPYTGKPCDRDARIEIPPERQGGDLKTMILLLESAAIMLQCGLEFCSSTLLHWKSPMSSNEFDG